MNVEPLAGGPTSTVAGRPGAPALLRRHWREAVLAAVLLALLAAFLAGGPTQQNQAYHEFADQRMLLGVPNLLDVASNLPFLAVGLAGLALCLDRRRPQPPAGARAAWAAMFAGVVLVCFGSAWYHWAPHDAALLWDRLPMTVGFMGLFVALLAEHVHPRLERLLLVPALATGVASVLWWQATGDLRWYYWVQFGPLACLPLVLALYPARFTHRLHLLYALGLYVLAKLAEAADAAIFQWTQQVVSGHTLKHLLAAGALLALLLMLKRRAPVQHAHAQGQAPATPA
jgi:hypothetical protein